MKLDWFSPLPPDHTEIGNVTARCLPKLAEAFDIRVFSETRVWDPALNRHCPVRNFTAQGLDWKDLNLGGIPVYHVGNNIHYHGEIMLAARRRPGVVVLHDLALHETVLNLCLLKGSGRAGYYDILHRYGGKESVEAGRRFLEEHEPDIGTLSVKYPLYEYILERAAGVITHNPLNVAPIRAATRAPVLYAPLPFLEIADLHPPARRVRASGRRYRILIFGFLGGANRRLRPFLEAFHKCPQRERFSITLAGKYPEKEVSGWLQELGLGHLVNLRGYISDPELDQLLRESDLAVNLRWPSMGESSATQLRIWNFSLPALVTDTAFYSTLPRDAVAFVDPEHETRDIQRHLEAFAADPESYFAMGLSGRRHLESEHSIEAFINNLQTFLPEVEAWRGMVHLQTFGRALARDYLAEYPDQKIRDYLSRRCAADLACWS